MVVPPSVFEPVSHLAGSQSASQPVSLSAVSLSAHCPAWCRLAEDELAVCEWKAQLDEVVPSVRCKLGSADERNSPAWASALTDLGQVQG